MMYTGVRHSFMAKLLGLFGSRDGNRSHVMTSSGAASVSIEKLLKSEDFKDSVQELKNSRVIDRPQRP